jgi:hypothetical protein
VERGRIRGYNGDIWEGCPIEGVSEQSQSVAGLERLATRMDSQWLVYKRLVLNGNQFSLVAGNEKIGIIEMFAKYCY